MDALKARPNDETTFVPKAPGSFQRGACNVQNWIEKDSGAEFPAEPGRYHVFLNYGCGWCHQVLETLAFRKLQTAITTTHVGAFRGGERGTPTYKGYVIHPDTDRSGHNLSCLREVYNVGCDNAYGVNQLTIPVLFDKKTKKVVSNDPAQMLLMFDFLAAELGAAEPSNSLYPPELQAEIEEVNKTVFPGVNNGVYCCWFGGKPGDAAYDEGFELVQNGLEWIENRLAQNKAAGKGPYLCGTDIPTLADVRAFPHLYRYDNIYYDLMLKQNGVRIFGTDAGKTPTFPLLAEWIRDRMFALPEVKWSCDLQVATRFYFSSLRVAESDVIYDKEREATGRWLPTREEWAAKRKEEGLMEVQLDIPNPSL